MKGKQKELKKTTILGAGMVGRVMVIDLRRNHQVKVIDREWKFLTALARAPHHPDTLSFGPSRINRVRTLRSRV